MPAIILSEASLSFGARTILQGVSLTLPKGRKAALAGANGSGKSTLMRILVGELAPDSGSLVCDKELRVSYLPQSGSRRSPLSLDAQASVYQEVEKAYAGQAALERELAALGEELGRYRRQTPELGRLLERHHELQEQLEQSGYYRRAEMIERVLQGLGFQRREFAQRAGSFSQGWQMRIALARVLCEGADILLLDEPTNFLDLEARNWLEGFLQETRAGVLVVSHDRYFLDSTVSEVLELYRGALSLYPGSFSAYERRRLEELARIGEAYERQQEELARIELFIRRFRYKATKARQVQSRIAALERLVRIEPPPVQKILHFSFPEPPHSGRLSLQAEDLAKVYGAKTVFRGSDLELARGEKWALVGPNGVGKSTLMRLLAGREAPSQGTVRYGSGVKIGYYCPEDVEGLDEDRSVEELVESWAPSQLMPQVRSLLGALLFRDEDVYKQVSVLSGGEKSRLALLRLLLRPANLLFLDEPTNHLDLSSKDVLLEALRRYPGTVVFVSHDRNFIEALADRVAAIEDAQVRAYPGDYAYYLWRRQQSQGGPERAASAAPAAASRREQGAVSTAPRPASSTGPRPAAVTQSPGAGGPADRSGAQAARLEEKARKRDVRRLEREEEELLARLDELQGEHAELEQALAREEVYRDGEQVKRIKEKLAAIGETQERLMKRWEQVESSLRAESTQRSRS